MLGGKEIRDIPQSDGYKDLILGVQFRDQSVKTFVRNFEGGPASLFEGDLRDPQSSSPVQKLKVRHQRESLDNISNFLLDELGIAGTQIRVNSSNRLQSMSFRNIAHLSVVDESRIQSKVSPVESGNSTTRTAEIAALKLVLSGEDDSSLTQGEDPREFARVNRGQLSVLDRAIEQVKNQINPAVSNEEVAANLSRIAPAIDSVSDSIAGVLVERQRVLDQRKDVEAQLESLRKSLKDAETLTSRFSLLHEKYKSDIERLEMVLEAGTLLGYFDSEVCVFCGAAPENQRHEHAMYETSQLVQAAEHEISKTHALKKDLEITIEDIASERSHNEETLAIQMTSLGDLQAKIRQIEARLEPLHSELNQLIESKSGWERESSFRDHLRQIENLRAGVSIETPRLPEEVGTPINVRTRGSFSETLRRILMRWQVPGSQRARMELTSPRPEIFIGEQPRSDRGKGMRAILHAAFSIALCEYCIENDLPHPGFVVLDTPVLTYRDADHPSDTELRDDELVSPTVAEAFYSYLIHEFPGQVVVIENQTPPELVDQDAVIYFSGTSGSGRSGFYPIASAL
jgi:hypothetical protein